MEFKQRKTYKETISAKSALLSSLRGCVVFLLLLFLSVHTASAQISFKELEQRMSKEKRYIVVYISSKHCTYCMMQDAQIKKNKELLQRLNNDFYFVEEMAEDVSPVVFNHVEYTNPDSKDPYQVNDFINVYGKNEKGIVAYPMWLYFDRDYRLVLHFYGLMPPKNILKVLDEIQKVDPLGNKQYYGMN